MAIESPLFQSAMELIGHSLSHYNGKKELDRKLVILHLANAVELILKDLVLDSGQSIYKNPKETITIQGCFTALSEEKIDLPYLNKIELLIDERNALQHRFGSPNELTSIFYTNIAQDFFKEILKKHYGQDYDELIAQFADEQDLVAYKLGEPSNDQELEKLQELAKIHPLGALLSAWSYFEKSTESFISKIGVDFRRHRPFTMDLARGRLDRFGIELPEELRLRLDSMRQLRNLSAHGRSKPTKKQVNETIKTIEEIESFFETLDLDKVRMFAEAEQKAFEERRMKMIRDRQKDEEELKRVLDGIDSATEKLD